MKNTVTPGFGKEPQSQVADLLSKLEWDFTQFKRDQYGSIFSYAEALMKTLDAMEKIGWVEHTGDWDPYLAIVLWNNDVILTEPGYFSIDKVEDGEVYFGAMSHEDMEVEEGFPEGCRTSEDGYNLVIKLLELKHIKVMT